MRVIARSKFQAVAIDISAVIRISRAISQVVLLSSRVRATVPSAGNPSAIDVAVGGVGSGCVTLGYGGYGSGCFQHRSRRLGGRGNAGVGIGSNRRGTLPLRMGRVVHDVIRAAKLVAGRS